MAGWGFDLCACGQRKQERSRRCRACYLAEISDGARQPGHMRFFLHAGDPGYGRVCPDCGGPKEPKSRRCWDCRGRGPRPISSDALHARGRLESIITFRAEDERTRSIHCFGRGKPAQIAYGLGQLPPGVEWEPICRSTPDSILRDLQKTAPVISIAVALVMALDAGEWLPAVLAVLLIVALVIAFRRGE